MAICWLLGPFLLQKDFQVFYQVAGTTFIDTCPVFSSLELIKLPFSGFTKFIEIFNNDNNSEIFRQVCLFSWSAAINQGPVYKRSLYNAL